MARLSRRSGCEVLRGKPLLGAAAAASALPLVTAALQAVALAWEALALKASLKAYSSMSASSPLPELVRIGDEARSSAVIVVVASELGGSGSLEARRAVRFA